MSNASWPKVLVTALVVALIMGGLGFTAGFLTRPLMVGEAPAATPAVIVSAVMESRSDDSSRSVAERTATPVPLEPTLAPTLTPVPTETPIPPLPSPTTPVTPSVDSQAFALFSEAWRLIQRDYYGEIPPDEEVVNSAIRGALNALGDPFTGYIEPKAAAINREDNSGSFEGIGAFVSMEEGQLMIVEPIKGQPAEAAGLRKGDIVLQAGDTPIENMSIYEAITYIRGPAGTQVRLKILRVGQDPFEVTITRARVEIQLVDSTMREDGVAYVSLTEFSDDASAKLGSAIEGLLLENPKGLILDLRGNPGGWLNEAVLVAGLFLPRDAVVLIERSKDGSERLYTTPASPIAPDIPLVVLVDGGSASASEIVAGALQDYKRAVLIGELTFGKGSVQWPEELSNGAELRVTVARWFTPNDRAIHGKGLEPDIAVEVTAEDVEAGRDPQLERAAVYLLSGQ